MMTKLSTSALFITAVLLIGQVVTNLGNAWLRLGTCSIQDHIGSRDKSLSTGTAAGLVVSINATRLN